MCLRITRHRDKEASTVVLIYGAPVEKLKNNAEISEARMFLYGTHMRTVGCVFSL